MHLFTDLLCNVRYCGALKADGASGGCLCDFVQPYLVQRGSVLIVSVGESGLFSCSCDLERAVVKLKDENHKACAEMSNISHLSSPFLTIFHRAICRQKSSPFLPST